MMASHQYPSAEMSCVMCSEEKNDIGPRFSDDSRSRVRKNYHFWALKAASSPRWKETSPLSEPSSSSSARPSPETSSISSDPAQVKWVAADIQRLKQQRPKQLLRWNRRTPQPRVQPLEIHRQDFQRIVHNHPDR